MLNLFKKLFLINEIRSKTGELHFRRWRILSTAKFSIFIHQIFKSDTDCPHDHPWDFLSVVLKGEYHEFNNYLANQKPRKLGMVSRRFGSILYRQATEMHTFDIVKPTTILVFTGERIRDWGYNIHGLWIYNKEYRRLKKKKEYLMFMIL